MNKLKQKKVREARRKLRIKKKLRRNKGVLRLCISKSNKNFYAQIIDDLKGETLVALSTQASEFTGDNNKANKSAAEKLGKLIAEKAVAKGIKKVVFDRNGMQFHGKIKIFADTARSNGLEF